MPDKPLVLSLGLVHTREDTSCPCSQFMHLTTVYFLLASDPCSIRATCGFSISDGILVVSVFASVVRLFTHPFLALVFSYIPSSLRQLMSGLSLYSSPNNFVNGDYGLLTYFAPVTSVLRTAT